MNPSHNYHHQITSAPVVLQQTLQETPSSSIYPIYPLYPLYHPNNNNLLNSLTIILVVALVAAIIVVISNPRSDQRRKAAIRQKKHLFVAALNKLLTDFKNGYVSFSLVKRRKRGDVAVMNVPTSKINIEELKKHLKTDLTFHTCTLQTDGNGNKLCVFSDFPEEEDPNNNYYCIYPPFPRLN